MFMKWNRMEKAWNLKFNWEINVYSFIIYRSFPVIYALRQGISTNKKNLVCHLSRSQIILWGHESQNISDILCEKFLTVYLKLSPYYCSTKSRYVLNLAETKLLWYFLHWKKSNVLLTWHLVSCILHSVSSILHPDTSDFLQHYLHLTRPPLILCFLNFKYHTTELRKHVFFLSQRNMM